MKPEKQDKTKNHTPKKLKIKQKHKKPKHTTKKKMKPAYKKVCQVLQKGGNFCFVR